MQTKFRYIFLNNQGLEHSKDYGVPNAFFDLSTVGEQTKKATDLQVGEICPVLQKREEPGFYRFDFFELEDIQVLENRRTGQTSRVFMGRLLETQVMPSSDAIDDPLLGCAFNVKGHIKRASVVDIK